MGKTKDKWNANYDALKAFVETYRHLPNKKKVEKSRPTKLVEV